MLIGIISTWLYNEVNVIMCHLPNKYLSILIKMYNVQKMSFVINSFSDVIEDFFQHLYNLNFICLEIPGTYTQNIENKFI